MARLLKERKTTTDILTIFAFTTFGLHLLTLFLLIFQGLTIHKLSNRKAPNLVQLVDGKAVSIINNLEREPEEVSDFVSKTMSAMFDWSGTLPAQTIEQVTNPQPDTGISIKTSQGFLKKVTTSSWVTSFALSQDFRKGFLALIADMTPVEVFTKNNNQAIQARLIIQRVYPPQKVAPGQWKVGIVANIVQFRPGDNRKILTPFNKDFLVRVVDSFEHPLPDEITNLQKAVYQIRAEKLEIYEILDLCLTDSSEDKSNRCGDNVNSGSFTR